MRTDIIILTDLDIPVWHDTFTGMQASNDKLSKVDQDEKHIVVVPEGLEIVVPVIQVLFGFDIRHHNNNYALHSKRDVVPCRIVLHENTGEQRNELEKQDDFEHFLVECDDLTLELVIDNLSESCLFIEVIVGLLNDIRD